MAPAGGSQRWYFSDELLANSPSRKSGVSSDKEESYRQQAANFIQDMGQRLQVTQLCINTAIVYMQRFYMFHSFARFHRNHIAAAALFLAAKVEEQPRKLEHVIKVSHVCLNRSEPQLETKSEKFLEQAQELHANENILLQTLGFDVAIDHPHTHVVKCCQMVKAHKELAQTSYFMATNSLHLTTMCLRYSPTIVACVCIHLACKWSQYQIPVSLEGRPWYSYVDQDANIDQIERLTSEFLAIFDKCPSRLKKKILQSHNDTKDQEERRKRENMQSDQYRIDFGNGDVANVSMNTQHALQGGNPLQGGGSGSGSSGLGSGSSSNSGGQSSNSGHPPPAKQPKYPPGHAPSSRPSSKPPGPGHGHPPGSKPTLQQHLHPGHKSSSVPGHPPGYRHGGSSSVRGIAEKSGQRPEAGHHQRSQSHGGQPLNEEQLRQQQRERHREQQYKQQQQKLQQQQQAHGAMSGYPPGYGRSASGSSLPPPYPGAGQQMPNKHNSSSASQHQSKSMPRSIFDLSPEKTARPEKPPLGPIPDPPMPFHESLLPTAPNYPQPGQHPSAPPSYSAPGPMSSYSSLPPYPKPSEPSFQLPQVAQVPQSLSPIRDIPPLSLNTRHPAPMDPSSMDTPTPTNIANMFSYPGGSKQPGSGYPMSTQAQMPNKSQQQRHDRSLQSLMGDFSHSQTSSDTKSKNLNRLFDDFDDLPVPQGLPQAPTIPSMSNQKQSKQHAVSDFSDLFGDDGDSSSLLSNLAQSSAASNLSSSFGGFPSSGLKPDLSSVKTETPGLASHSGVMSMSASVKTEYMEHKVKKEETDTKRRNTDKLQSDEKKPRISKTGGLFSPSPTDEKPNLSSLKSPIKSEQDHKRSRTTSSSKDPDAVVSVQKLENLAPEFQAFRGSNAPASIILGPNDRPSPSKKKEGDPSPKKEKQESSQEKRRSGSGSGASREKRSSPEAGASNSSPRSEEKNRDHKKKKEKKEKKDKNKKDKKDKRKESGDSKKDDDKDKKHKKSKSKDKDKEKERDKDKNKTPNVKIKMSGTPSVSPGRDSGQEGGSGMPAIPKITLKLGGGITRITGGGGDGDTDSPSKKDKDSRKRERSASSAKLDKFEVPAAKMARATGADPSRESKFLEESFKKKGHR